MDRHTKLLSYHESSDRWEVACIRTQLMDRKGKHFSVPRHVMMVPPMLPWERMKEGGFARPQPRPN
jgi:hypothetical protein